LGWERGRPPKNKLPPPVADHLKTIPPHMCYQMKFGSYASKGVCIDRKETPKIGECWDPAPLGGGLDDP